MVDVRHVDLWRIHGNFMVLWLVHTGHGERVVHRLAAVFKVGGLPSGGMRFEVLLAALGYLSGGAIGFAGCFG